MIPSACLESGIQLHSLQDFAGFGTSLEDTLAIDQEGIYYLGIHACSFQDQKGLALSQFSIKNLNRIYHIDTSICQGEPFSFAGQALSQSGIYTDTLQNLSGMDSIVCLNLQVNPSYLFSLDTLICQGSEMTFGGNTYREAGEYEESYQSKDGCDSIYRLRLEILPIPEPPIISQTTVLGQTVLVSNQESGNQWYKDGSALAGENEIDLVPTQSGLYHATVRNACGESGPSNKIEIEGLSNPSDPIAESFRVYPNPARNHLHVKSPSQRIERMEIFNMNGKRIYSGLPKARSCRLDVSAWTPGTYILQIQIKDKTMPFKIEIAR